MSFVYDAAVLIAADRDDRDVWADHRARLELELVPITTAPVVAQVSRSPRQASLHRFLRGCQTVSFAPGEAGAVGALLARAGSSDVVDAHLAITASHVAGVVVTADIFDMTALAGRTSGLILREAPKPLVRMKPGNRFWTIRGVSSHLDSPVSVVPLP